MSYFYSIEKEKSKDIKETIEAIEKENSPVIFFLDAKDFIENFDYAVKKKLNLIIKSDEANKKLLSKKNSFESKTSKRLLILNGNFDLNNFSKYDMITNLEISKKNDGIYKSNTLLNHKFAKELKKKGIIYLVDLDMIRVAISQKDSKVLLRLKQSIKNIFKYDLDLILCDTSFRNYEINDKIDFIFNLGINNKNLIRKKLEKNHFLLEKEIAFK